MFCKKCRIKMKVSSHRPHKKEKWQCQRCGRVRMKPAVYRRKKKNGRVV